MNSKFETQSKPDDGTSAQHKFLRALVEHRDTVNAVSMDLLGLAQALRRVGMRDAAEEIAQNLMFLRASMEELDQEHGRMIRAELVASQQSSMAMLRGVLAGVAIGSGKEPHPLVSQ